MYKVQYRIDEFLRENTKFGSKYNPDKDDDTQFYVREITRKLEALEDFVLQKVNSENS